MQTSSGGRSRTDRSDELYQTWQQAKRETVRAAELVELNPGHGHWGRKLAEAKAAEARAHARYLEARGQQKLQLL